MRYFGNLVQYWSYLLNHYKQTISLQLWFELRINACSITPPKEWHFATSYILPVYHCLRNTTYIRRVVIILLHMCQKIVKSLNAPFTLRTIIIIFEILVTRSCHLQRTSSLSIYTKNIKVVFLGWAFKNNLINTVKMVSKLNRTVIAFAVSLSMEI